MHGYITAQLKKTCKIKKEIRIINRKLYVINGTSLHFFFYTFKLRYLIRRISFNDNDLNELLFFLDLLMSVSTTTKFYTRLGFYFSRCNLKNVGINLH